MDIIGLLKANAGFILAVAALLGWLGYKAAKRSIRQRKLNAGLDQAESLMDRLGAELARYAEHHGLRLPGSLGELELDEDLTRFAESVQYRSVPNLECDDRSILLAQTRSAFHVSEFAESQPARLIMLLSGKVLLLSDGALERMIADDERLREQQSLEPIPESPLGA